MDNEGERIDTAAGAEALAASVQRGLGARSAFELLPRDEKQPVAPAQFRQFERVRAELAYDDKGNPVVRLGEPDNQRELEGVYRFMLISGSPGSYEQPILALWMAHPGREPMAVPSVELVDLPGLMQRADRLSFELAGSVAERRRIAGKAVELAEEYAAMLEQSVVMLAIEQTIAVCAAHERDKVPNEARVVNYAAILEDCRRTVRARDGYRHDPVSMAERLTEDQRPVYENCGAVVAHAWQLAESSREAARDALNNGYDSAETALHVELAGAVRALSRELMLAEGTISHLVRTMRAGEGDQPGLVVSAGLTGNPDGTVVATDSGAGGAP